mmetsp:Transcript_966/g.1054  ORF Transcript_966/g.1054 Transcript_966/m.1054 type:complete len:203 (-) Transcript_966:176-784(-)
MKYMGVVLVSVRGDTILNLGTNALVYASAANWGVGQATVAQLSPDSIQVSRAHRCDKRASHHVENDPITGHCGDKHDWAWMHGRVNRRQEGVSVANVCTDVWAHIERVQQEAGQEHYGLLLHVQEASVNIVEPSLDSRLYGIWRLEKLSIDNISRCSLSRHDEVPHHEVHCQTVHCQLDLRSIMQPQPLCLREPVHCEYWGG